MNADSYASVSLMEGYLLHGHYKILNMLGRGGFSFTYKALDKNLDRIVAIKEYFPSSLCARSGLTVAPIDATSRDGYEAGLKSFIKEAQTLARFRNDHICSVLDYFQGNGTAYLVMPYISGESLDIVLKKCPNGVMNSDAVRKLILPLLNALRDVHSASCMHRDIKPSNIYVGYDGEPILIDFGAARETVGRTHGYTVVLTPQYAPPEQSTADISSQGPWTDIYALAAVAYRCLMGTPPPEAQKRVFAVASGETDPLNATLPHLKNVADAGLYEFITKALVLPYAKRIQSVDEVEKILKAVPVSTTEQGSSNAIANVIIALAIIYVVCFCYKLSTEPKIETSNQAVQQQYNQTTQQQYNQTTQQQYNQTQSNKSDTRNTEYIVEKKLDEGIKNYEQGCFYTAAENFRTCLSYKNSGLDGLFVYRQGKCANYLAIMYSKGQGGLQVDETEAFKLFEFSARTGYPSGMFNLATRYYYGQGTEQNTYYAVLWYSQAEKANDPDAAEILGQIYENGHGNVHADHDQALAWYKEAVRLGKSNKDIQKAIKRLQRSK